MLDSLVRVSRRVDKNHFVNILASQFFLDPDHSRIPKLKKRTTAEAVPLYLLESHFLQSESMLTHGLQASLQTQVLDPIASLLAISSTFHSLFKVLCIFPSRYLFAIGLLLIFSFRWNLPPTLSCTRKQLDSLGTYRTQL